MLIESLPEVESAEVSEDDERVLKLLMAELPLKQAVKLATEITGAKKNALYEHGLKIKDSFES
ncbi:hypothetical protein D9M69_715010 [compost metagenome]